MSLTHPCPVPGNGELSLQFTQGSITNEGKRLRTKTCFFLHLMKAKWFIIDKALVSCLLIPF